MPKLESFTVPLPKRQKVDIHIIELDDGRIVARTLDELDVAPDDVRIAAGLAPRSEGA